MEDRLQKFARLVDAGSFTKASKELHLSQPALSLSIAKLERELRAPLLLREGRGLQLTEAGRIAYASAKELRLTTEHLRLKLAEQAAQKLTASIGMIDSIASCLLHAEGSLASLDSEAHIGIDVHNSRHLQERVLRGQLDMAFVVEQPLLARGNLEITPVGREPLVVVCHSSQQASLQKQLKAGKLAPFISYDQPSVTRDIIAQHLASKRISITPTFYSTSPDVMLRLVLLKKGAAALPYLQVQDLVLAKQLHVLTHDNTVLLIDRPIVRIKNKQKPLPPTLEQLTKELRSRLEALRHSIG